MNVIEFNGEAVVETNDLAEMYCQSVSDLKRMLFQNQNRFKEGEHFYLLDNRFEDLEEFKKQHLSRQCTHDQNIYLWTDHGLYELAALMKGKHAWHSYCQFIHFVFKQSEEVKKAIEVLQKAEDIIAKEKFLYYLAKELFQNETTIR